MQTGNEEAVKKPTRMLRFAFVHIVIRAITLGITDCISANCALASLQVHVNECC